MSECPSPFGEMNPDVERDVTMAGVRSRVTTLATAARLFEASAVQTVIRYVPSGTIVPLPSLPSQVKPAALPGASPDRTALPATPSTSGTTTQP